MKLSEKDMYAVYDLISILNSYYETEKISFFHVEIMGVTVKVFVSQNGLQSEYNFMNKKFKTVHDMCLHITNKLLEWVK